MIKLDTKTFVFRWGPDYYKQLHTIPRKRYLNLTNLDVVGYQNRCVYLGPKLFQPTSHHHPQTLFKLHKTGYQTLCVYLGPNLFQPTSHDLPQTLFNLHNLRYLTIQNPLCLSLPPLISSIFTRTPANAV